MTVAELEDEVMETNPIKEMMDDMVQIVRDSHSPMGTFGKLYYRDFKCYTVEKPWENNAQFISCIPVGIYPIELGRYNRGGYPCYELKQVPARSQIKIHVANIATDVMGCVGLGNLLGVVDKWWAVLNSRVTHEAFMEAMGGMKQGYIAVSNIADIGEWKDPKRR